VHPSPNLFIVGAQKSGTTSLHAALASHPDIFMSDPKEPAFFIPAKWRPRDVYGTASTDEEYLQIYLNLFRDAGNCRYIGEASTAYTTLPRYEPSAAAIHAFAPDARILYIMRDPIERTISHYWWNCQHETETRPPLRAVAENPDYCSFSYYALQIRPYLEHFSRDRVWCLTTEGFSTNAAEELVRLYGWLDLDANRQSAWDGPRENITPKTIVQKHSRALDLLRRSSGYNAIRWLIPAPLRRWARQSNEIRIDRSQARLEEVKEYLRPIQLRQTEELAALLGREFPEWRTLFA
jgi:hypothetical protein